MQSRQYQRNGETNNGETRRSTQSENWRESKDWLAYRAIWLSENPPLDNHCYLCGICARWVRYEEVTLDHIDPRRKTNLFDPTNIQPAHGLCNYLKGSRRLKPKVDTEVYEFLYYLSDM